MCAPRSSDAVCAATRTKASFGLITGARAENASRGATGSPRIQPQRAAQIARRQSLNAHDLFARALATDHADPPARDTGAPGDQLAQRQVRLALDGCCRNTYAQNTFALVHYRVALCTRLESDLEIYVGHRWSMRRMPKRLAQAAPRNRKGRPKAAPHPCRRGEHIERLKSRDAAQPSGGRRSREQLLANGFEIAVAKLSLLPQEIADQFIQVFGLRLVRERTALPQTCAS